MSEFEKREILYDTDIGSDVDDALALAFLSNAAKSRLTGISVVYGPVETRANAAKTLLGLQKNYHPEVVMGFSTPLTPNVPIWVTGFEDYNVSPNQKISNLSLTDFYQRDEKFILLSTGPLTNVAALVESKSFQEKCNGIVMMGGSIRPDGWIPQDEHNFCTDPLATKAVFASGIDITIVPLDLTLKIPMTENQLLQFKESKSKHGKLLYSWINKWLEYTLDNFKKYPQFFGKVYFHDPIAASYLVYPELFTTEHLKVNISNEGFVNVGKGKEVTICNSTDKSLTQRIVDTILR